MNSPPRTCEGVEHGCWLQQIIPLLPERQEHADRPDDRKADAEDGNGCSWNAVFCQRKKKPQKMTVCAHFEPAAISCGDIAVAHSEKYVHSWRWGEVALVNYFPHMKTGANTVHVSLECGGYKIRAGRGKHFLNTYWGSPGHLCSSAHLYGADGAPGWSSFGSAV